MGKTRSIQELLKATSRLDCDGYTVLCPFVGYDPLTFEEVSQNDKWRTIMKDEINSISKKNT